MTECDYDFVEHAINKLVRTQIEDAIPLSYIHAYMKPYVEQCEKLAESYGGPFSEGALNDARYMSLITFVDGVAGMITTWKKIGNKS